MKFVISVQVLAPSRFAQMNGFLSPAPSICHWLDKQMALPTVTMSGWSEYSNKQWNILIAPQFVLFVVISAH